MDAQTEHDEEPQNKDDGEDLTSSKSVAGDVDPVGMDECIESKVVRTDVRADVKDMETLAATLSDAKTDANAEESELPDRVGAVEEVHTESVLACSSGAMENGPIAPTL